MKVEGINLTPVMIDNIRWIQDNPDVLQDHLNKLDHVIATIAADNESEKQETAKLALQQISFLFYLKGVYQSLAEKE